MTAAAMSVEHLTCGGHWLAPFSRITSNPQRTLWASTVTLQSPIRKPPHSRGQQQKVNLCTRCRNTARQTHEWAKQGEWTARRALARHPGHTQAEIQLLEATRKETDRGGDVGRETGWACVTCFSNSAVSFSLKQTNKQKSQSNILKVKKVIHPENSMVNQIL